MKMFLAIYYFCYYRWCRQNSHDLNTAYTCDRYQQVQILINTNDSASDLNIQAMCFKFLNLNFFSVIENGRVILTDDRRRHQSEETVDRVSLYLTLLAFSAPTDVFTDSIAIALQGETMGMHKVRIVSLSPKAVSKQDGIVKVPEETDCNEHL
ncbi:hypothetical protein Tsp_02898 [Trichinella spiralis]|uniref:hypothetical protein n=1 Tax=Trichinella spiralis TaxID=6334 RepID=UPI0001EFCB93|nr:hypothetical protein Tsp_02898 [Trichinella spiralis]